MSVRDTSTRVAVLKALRDRLDDEYTAAREALTGELLTAWREQRQDRATAELPDGTPVATVSLSMPKDTISVTDERAFTAWVRRAHPTEAQLEMRVTVRSSYRAALLSEMTKSGALVDPETGEPVPGVARVPGGEPSTFSLRFAAAGREAVAEAWRRGDLAELVAGTPALPPPGAETAAPEPHAEPVKAITRTQLTKLHTTLTSLGVADRDERRVVVGLIVGRELSSTRELTRDEASHVIDTLARIEQRDEPYAALVELLGALNSARTAAAGQ